MPQKGFNHIPAVIARLPGAGHDLIEKVVVDIAAGAGATAPIDTGALAASYFHEIEGLSGIAGTNIEYAPYVEYGTHRSPAQPHLVPAADRVLGALSGGGITVRKFGQDIEEAAKHG